MSKTLLFTLILCLSFFNIKAQFVNIPDSNFKNHVLWTVPHPTSTKDITYAEAAAYTGAINVDYDYITSIVGIEAFVNLTSLSCNGDDILSMDLSHNQELTYLSFSSVHSAVDLSNHPKLQYLYGLNNWNLYGLNLNNDTSLIHIEISYAPFTGIDLSTCKNLSYLDIYNCHLGGLNLNGNKLLTYLNCSGNPKMNTLDLSNNIALNYVNCKGDGLILLDVSKNGILNYLDCSFNSLSSLNVSNNNLMETFNCSFNTLSFLDLTNNINLKRLFCDNTNFNTVDLTKNINIKYLQIGSTYMSSLDLSKNTLLNYLVCVNLNMNTIDVSKNLLLDTLYLGNTGFTFIDVSKNKLLSRFYCSYNNRIRSIDVSANTALTELDCSNVDSLSSLDLRMGYPYYKSLWFTATSNYSLNCIKVDSVSYANKNWVNYKDTKAIFNKDCIGLPLSLISFENTFNTNNINLKWVTAQETNVLKFEVERSINSSDFVTIGFLNAKNETQNTYLFDDNKLMLVTAFYRLKIIDKDGSFSYSKIISAAPESTNNLCVYPNPTTSNNINIQLSLKNNDIIRFEIVDTRSRTISTQQYNLNKGYNNLFLKFPSNNSIVPGTYYLKATGKSIEYIKPIVIIN